MRKILLLLTVIFSLQITYASSLDPDTTKHLNEDTTAKNTIYFGLLGNTPTISINYDRIISKQLSIKLGLGLFFIHYAWGFPLNFSLNYLNGPLNSKIEYNLGVTEVFGVEGNNNFTMVSFGTHYRYQSELGGIFFRIGLDLVLSINETALLYPIPLPIPEISIGHTF